MGGEQAIPPFNVNWLNAVFLFGIPPLAVVTAIWHGFTFGIGWAEALIFLIWYLACGMSITVGYHRLFSHRSHTAVWPLRLVYALFGAGAFQNSILEWSSDHRRHHKHTDHETSDPYSAKKGFWWSHFLWIFLEPIDKDRDHSNVRDLQDDWVVRFQHRHVFLLGFIFGMVLPGVFGYLLGGIGSGIGGFVWGGLIRTVFVHHGTFLINSAAHVWGTQPYSEKDSSKDSPWLAFLTFGEGYHNYHHAFQADYRNGHRWWQWDPSKWWIRICSFLGLTKNLKMTPNWKVEIARMDTSFSVAESDCQDRGIEPTVIESFSERARLTRQRMIEMMRELERKHAQRKVARKELRRQLTGQIVELRRSIGNIRVEYTELIREMTRPSRTAAA